ncbi:MAG: hypothetical protein GY739_01045 [Mesoflavibacter sp.]|nr:hypothetical protein [Mesoflavibacter sp.]
MNSKKTNEFKKKLNENPNDTKIIMNFLMEEFQRIEELQTKQKANDDDYIAVDTEFLNFLQHLHKDKN